MVRVVVETGDLVEPTGDCMRVWWHSGAYLSSATMVPLGWPGTKQAACPARHFLGQAGGSDMACRLLPAPRGRWGRRRRRRRGLWRWRRWRPWGGTARHLNS